MTNIGTYFEIPVTDLERAMKFYASVFDCEFTQENLHGNEMAFFPYHAGKDGITGALAKGETYRPSLDGSLVYLGTPDIDLTLQRLHERGAEILFPKTLVPDIGFVAEFRDCEGNRIGLFQRA